MSDAVHGTPSADGFAMPAEWAPHEATLIAWPTRSRSDLWGELFASAQREYAGVANAIAAFEPVVMVVDPSQVGEARSFLVGRSSCSPSRSTTRGSATAGLSS